MNNIDAARLIISEMEYIQSVLDVVLAGIIVVFLASVLVLHYAGKNMHWALTLVFVCLIPVSFVAGARTIAVERLVSFDNENFCDAVYRRLYATDIVEAHNFIRSECLNTNVHVIYKNGIGTDSLVAVLYHGKREADFARVQYQMTQYLSALAAGKEGTEYRNRKDVRYRFGLYVDSYTSRNPGTQIWLKK